MEWLKYREIEGPHNTKPEIMQTAVGREVFWEPKRDGSNISIDFLSGELAIHTRNQIAIDSVKEEVVSLIEPFREELIAILGDRYIGYFELVRKGSSPARFENNDTPSILLFDICDSVTGEYLHPDERTLLVRRYNIPHISLWRVSVSSRLEDFRNECDRKIDEALCHGFEGFVGKWVDSNMESHAVKCKVEQKYPPPKRDKIPKPKDDRPPLEASEVRGAIDKVRNDIGVEAFRDKSKAMPLVAKYVREEEQKHGKKNTMNMFAAYQEYLSELV